MAHPDLDEKTINLVKEAMFWHEIEFSPPKKRPNLCSLYENLINGDTKEKDILEFLDRVRRGCPKEAFAMQQAIFFYDKRQRSYSLEKKEQKPEWSDITDRLGPASYG